MCQLHLNPIEQNYVMKKVYRKTIPERFCEHATRAFPLVPAFSGCTYSVRPEPAVGVGPEGISEAVLGGVGGVLNVLQKAPAVVGLSAPTNSILI